METLYNKNGYQITHISRGNFEVVYHGEVIGKYFTYSAAVVRCNCHRMATNNSPIFVEQTS